MDNTKNILLKDGRFFERVETFRDLGPQNELLSELMDTSALVLPNIMSLDLNVPATSTCESPVFSLDVSLVHNKNQIILGAEIPFFPIYGTWTTSEEGIDRFTGRKSDEEVRSDEKLKRHAWAYPCVRQFFINEYARETRDHLQSYMLFIYAEAGRLHPFVPNLMNIYPDGRVCLGADQNGSDAPRDFVSKFAHTVSDFFSTRANQDLNWEDRMSFFKDGSWHLPENTLERPNQRAAYFRSNHGRLNNATMVTFYENFVRPQYPDHTPL
jgi:hypothetical protein